MLPLALSFILTACAQATISSPGKSDDAIRADMNSCDAGSLTLHSRPVINCLSNHGDTITYADGRIPPYTSGNPYDIPLTAPEVQGRKAAATAALERWQAAARNSAQNASVTAQPSQQMPAATTAVNSYQAPVNNPSTAVAPTPVATTPEPVAGAQYGVGDLRAVVSSYTENRMKFDRLYSGKSFGFDGYPWGTMQMEDVSYGYLVLFNSNLQGRDHPLAAAIFGALVGCANVNDEETIDRVNQWLKADTPPRVRVRGTVVDSDGYKGGLRLVNCSMDGP
jgi:hypothetical protein